MRAQHLPDLYTGEIGFFSFPICVWSKTTDGCCYNPKILFDHDTMTPRFIYRKKKKKPS